MSAKFTGEEILTAAAGKLVCGGFARTNGSGAGGLAWNLTELIPGDWFIAMSDGAEDTHDQLADAFDLGARGCICNKQNRYSFTNGTGTLISVADTRVAMLELLSLWRQVVNPKVIAVVGTGRKTIMNILEFLLKDTYRCHKAFESNGLSCIPAVLEMPKETELLIAELSGVERGDIARIGACLSPDIAVIAKTQHPLPSPERDAKIAALHCEILDTIRDHDGACAVVYDQNRAVKERSKRMLGGLRSVLFSQSPELLDRRELHWLKNTIDANDGHEPSEVDLWCAVKAAQALGLSLARKEEFINLS